MMSSLFVAIEPTTPKQSSIKQPLFYDAQGLCESGIWMGSSSDGLPLLLNVWGISGDTRRLEVTQQLSIIWRCLHICVCWLIAVSQGLSSDCEAEHLCVSSPCFLGFLMGWQLCYKQEEEAATLSLLIFY